MSLRTLLARASMLFLAIAVHPLAAEPAADPAALFSYDTTAPLALQEVGRVTRSGAVIRDVTFLGVQEPVNAYVVSPSGGAGPHAGILFVHWLGKPATTNRTEFLDEAVALAARGVVSVLVDAMWTKQGWYQARVPEQDFADSVRQVVELRRALDVLVAQSGVDPQRLAVVGHDFGAMYGAMAGAADHRPKTYVLIAGTPRFSDWVAFGPKPKDLEAYRRQMAAIDPVTLLPRLAPASVFLQFGSKDSYIPPERALEFYAVAAPRKQSATYEAPHEMSVPAATADRRVWLERELGLQP